MALSVVILIFGLSRGHAHFNLNVNIRIIHVDREADGLRMFIRLPMAYLVADKLGPERTDGTRNPAPFSVNATEAGQLVHYLDADQLRSNPLGLGKIISDGHQITVSDKSIAGTVLHLRAYPALNQPPFAKLAEAKQAMKGPVYGKEFAVTYVGDTVIDAEIFYRTNNVGSHYTLHSTLDPKLPRQADTANLILDHVGGDTLIFRLRGLLSAPLQVSRSKLKAFATFVTEGIRHILGGADHVLFVLCLVLGAMTLTTLLWRVTGFTIGHSVTLLAGFFGYVPQGAWFIPAVETAIALSIILAAVAALSEQNIRGGTLVTTAIGLLHGFGFSFLLQEILKVDSPDLWQSLLAFNVGVEVGQIGIVLLTWPLLFWLSRRSPNQANTVRWTLAIGCIAIASLWTGQRTLQVIAAL